MRRAEKLAPTSVSRRKPGFTKVMKRIVVRSRRRDWKHRGADAGTRLRDFIYGVPCLLLPVLDVLANWGAG